MKLWLRVPLVKSDGVSTNATSKDLVSRWIKVDAIFRLFLLFVPSQIFKAACVYRPYKPIHINE